MGNWGPGESVSVSVPSVYTVVAPVASGDTSGVTDTANLSAVINSLDGHGGSIGVPAGLYYVNAALPLLSQYQYVWGQGQDATQFKIAAGAAITGSMLSTVANSEAVGIFGVSFNGKYGTVTDALVTYNGVFASSWLWNCKFYYATAAVAGTGGYGFHITSPSGSGCGPIDVMNCFLTSSTNHNLYADGSLVSLRFRNILTQDMINVASYTNSNGPAGIYIDGSTNSGGAPVDISFEGIHLECNATPNTYGIYLNQVAEAHIKDVLCNAESTGGLELVHIVNTPTLGHHMIMVENAIPRSIPTTLNDVDNGVVFTDNVDQYVNIS